VEGRGVQYNTKAEECNNLLKSRKLKKKIRKFRKLKKEASSHLAELSHT
jgi:hypothetical protein